MAIHIGKLIEEKLLLSHLSRKEFAERIRRSRSHVYTILQRPHIDTEDLLAISKVLKHDFFQHFSKAIRPYVPIDDLEQELAEKTTMRNLSQHDELEMLRLENAYLKEINTLLKEKIKND